MDGLRGSEFGADGNDQGADTDDMIEAPPPVIGQDERRMQVRAYNYWAGLLGKRRFPAPDLLIAGIVPDFGANAVLLHFSDGLDNPAVLALGAALAAECGEHGPIARLSDVPGRSVLSRITDHYLQIIANEAPIGFEAEFVNQRGAAVLYRGILLPFSSDDTAIDYIYGVINWKELADQRMTDELMMEIGQALGETAMAAPRPKIARGVDTRANDTSPDIAWPDIAWPSVASPGGAWADGPTASANRTEPDKDAIDPLDLAPFIDGHANDQSKVPDSAAEPTTLVEWLETARASALRAIANEDRTRQSLYGAIARAWDFALAAQAAPDDYARLVAQAGLRLQERAPLIPLVKLVFGADYDKTRLTEYATVLGHARRIGLGKGDLVSFLAQIPGGIKAVVARERAARRGEDRAADAARGWQAAARALPGRPFAELSRDGAEFALVMVRRQAGGEPAMIGEISEDAALLARAARHFAADA
jgi:hypothetical protein